jgi:hypothetical protein
MERRKLNFGRFESVAADINHLHTAGYTQVGSWDLSQACDHLTRYMRMSLEGFPFEFPWVMRRLVGPAILKPLVLWTHWLPAGAKAPRPLVPERSPQEPAAVEAVIEMLHRVRNHPDRFAPSPLFGELSNSQWRQVHLIHASHHLSFLVPSEAAPVPQQRQTLVTDD